MPQQPQQQQQRHPVRQIDGKMGAVDIDVTGARLLSRLPSREGDGYMTHLYLQYQTHTMTFKEREAISQRAGGVQRATASMAVAFQRRSALSIEHVNAHRP